MSFNHFDDKGNAVMVDVSAKQPSLRTATVSYTHLTLPTKRIV